MTYFNILLNLYYEINIFKGLRICMNYNVTLQLWVLQNNYKYTKYMNKGFCSCIHEKEIKKT